ncbi:MAG: hypothetical protein JRI68_32860 [Deltaproteobacteria bacterium]|nr:hypothetical protein [Deltaproteobacteria bacterium]
MPNDSPDRTTRERKTGTARRVSAGTLGWWAGCSVLVTACPGPGTGGAGPDPPTVQVPADPADETPTPVPPAGPQSCSLTTSAWHALDADEQGSPLRAAGSSEPFAYVLGGTARIKLAASTAADAVSITVSSGGVELRGVMAAGSLPIHPRRPIVFEGYAIPKASAQLLWRGGGPGGIRVSYAVAGGLEADKLQATVPCSALTLDVTTFDATRKVLGTTRGRLARLRFDEKKPLSTTAGSAAVAWIDPDAPDDDGYYTDQVRELHFDGTHSRIVWDRPRDVLFGWVPADAIYVLEDDERDVLEEDVANMVGVLHGAEADSQSGLRRCREALPLFASVSDGRPVPVGTLRAGVAFDVLEQEEAMTSLVVPDVLDAAGPFLLGEDTRIVAHEAALASCGEIP